jgi:hypothetical protein
MRACTSASEWRTGEVDRSGLGRGEALGARRVLPSARGEAKRRIVLRALHVGRDATDYLNGSALFLGGSTEELTGALGFAVDALRPENGHGLAGQRFDGGGVVAASVELGELDGPVTGR